MSSPGSLILGSTLAGGRYSEGLGVLKLNSSAIPLKPTTDMTTATDETLEMVCLVALVSIDYIGSSSERFRQFRRGPKLPVFGNRETVTSRFISRRDWGILAAIWTAPDVPFLGKLPNS